MVGDGLEAVGPFSFDFVQVGVRIPNAQTSNDVGFPNNQLSSTAAGKPPRAQPATRGRVGLDIPE
jgi:hypothetical protein